MTGNDKVLINLRPLSTGREQCLMLRTGKIEADKLHQAEENRYDQLPVLDPSGRLCGLIATDRARSLLEAGDELSSETIDLEFCTVSDRIDLFDLLKDLAEYRAIVFRSDDNDGIHDEDWFALVTISDLNRPPFRAYLYPLLARLETLLAELIERTYKDPWTWIRWTSQHSRPTIVGRWELDKRDNIDTSPLNGCEFRDLATVVSTSRSLCRQLSLDKDQIRQLTKVIPERRNDIMHPVRALVRCQKDVESLRKQLEFLVQLSDRIDNLVQALNKNAGNSESFLP